MKQENRHCSTDRLLLPCAARRNVDILRSGWVKVPSIVFGRIRLDCGWPSACGRRVIAVRPRRLDGSFVRGRTPWHRIFGLIVRFTGSRLSVLRRHKITSHGHGAYVYWRVLIRFPLPRPLPGHWFSLQGEEGQVWPRLTWRQYSELCIEGKNSGCLFVTAVLLHCGARRRLFSGVHPPA